MRPDQKVSRSASLLLIRMEADDGRGNRLDLGDQMIDFGWRAIEFDDQQSLDVERVADIDESLGGVDRRPVHRPSTPE